MTGFLLGVIACLLIALAVCLFFLGHIHRHYPSILRTPIGDRLGPLGIRGWFIGQWRRLTGFRPDYRMTPEGNTGQMVGWSPVQWGPPTFMAREGRLPVTPEPEENTLSLDQMAAALQAGVHEWVLEDHRWKMQDNIRPADTPSPAAKIEVARESREVLGAQLSGAHRSTSTGQLSEEVQ